MPQNLAIETDSWQAARDSVAAGVSLAATAKQLGLNYHLLKKRAQRQNWSRPHLAIRKAKDARARIASVSALSPSVSGGSKTQESDVKPSSGDLSAQEKTGTVILDAARELAESGSLMGAKLWHRQLVDASRDDAELAPIVDGKDIMVAVKGLRLVAGLDQNQPQVQLNLWGNTHAVPARMGTRPETETHPSGILDAEEL